MTDGKERERQELAEEEQERPEGDPEPEAEEEAPREGEAKGDAERILRYWGWRKGEITLLDRDEYEGQQDARRRQEEKQGWSEPEEEDEEQESSVERVIAVSGPLRRVVIRAEDAVAAPVDLFASHADPAELYPIQPIPPSGRPKIKRRKKKRKRRDEELYPNGAVKKHGEHVGQQGTPEGGSREGYTHVPGSLPESGDLGGEEGPYHTSPDLTYDERLIAIREYLESEGHENYEELFLITQNGKIINSRSGNKEEVEVTEEMRSAAESATDAGDVITAIHNHPSGRPFSPSDLLVAYTLKIERMIVISSNPEHRRKYTLSLSKVIEDGWNERDPEKAGDWWNKNVAWRFNNIEHALYTTLEAKINSGEIGLDEANLMFSEGRWMMAHDSGIVEFEMED